MGRFGSATKQVNADEERSMVKVWLSVLSRTAERRSETVARVLTLAAAMIAAWLVLQPTAAWADAGDGAVAGKLASEQWDELRWYTLSLNGQRAGWSRQGRRTLDDGGEETLIEMYMRLGRIGVPMVVHTESRTIETADGKLDRVEQFKREGDSETRESYAFDHDAGVVRVRIDRGEAGVSEREVAIPGGDWLTPSEAGELMSRRLRAGAERVSHSELLADSGSVRVIRATFERTGSETLTVGEREYEAIVGEVTTEQLPGVVMRHWVDADGSTLRTSGRIGGLLIEERLSTAAAAMEAWETPEFMVEMLVRPLGEIDGPRELRAAAYIVSARDGELPDLPPTSVQRVRMGGDGDSARVAIALDSPRLTPEMDEAEREALLEPSLMADSDDAAVRELVERALAGVAAEASDAEKAEALRRFVFEFVASKNLDRGFASASEVARLREGDCTEHAVLLVAMLRAAEIPARAANGLLFADGLGGVDEAGERLGAFGYHMWAQALVMDDELGGEVWMDVDASWERAMDATRIVMSVSTLNDDEGFDPMLQLVQFMNNIEIVVLGTGERAEEFAEALDRGEAPADLEAPAPAGE